MVILMTPVPKPRMTQQDRWAKRPSVVRYRDFCDELRLKWGNRDVPEKVDLKFYLPMPQSWSKKKRQEMRHQPHQQTPDIDNLVKAFLDALCENDAFVYGVRAEKYWEDDGQIWVSSY